MCSPCTGTELEKQAQGVEVDRFTMQAAIQEQGCHLMMIGGLVAMIMMMVLDGKAMY